MFVAQGSSCKEKGDACKGAESTCDPESSLIIPGMCPNEACAASSQSGPKLMGCNDPSINDSGIFATEAVRGEPYRRGYGGNPVEPIEDGEPVRF